MSDPATAEKPGPHAGAPPFPAPRWEIFSWCMFDFANSSFTTAITTVIFAVYFNKVICADRPDSADRLWGLANAISQTIVLLTAPIVGAIADFSGAKKKFLTVSWLGCCLFTACLWFATKGDVWTGMTILILANMFYSAGENLTASFLPELTKPENMGKVSGYGWAWGYVGGLCSLALCFPLIRHGIDLDHSTQVRATNLVTGAFFFVAALPTIFLLRERKSPQPLPPGQTYLTYGWKQIFDTIKRVKQFRELAKFLGVFLVYNCGITIIVCFASVYADKTLKLGPLDLIVFFLILQVTSAIGAFVFGFVQDRWGARLTLNLALVIWLGVCLGAYFVTSKGWFYVIGNFAGLSIGASQSGARALVGVLSPPSRSAEFFGFWGLFWKLSSVVGPYVFGAVSSAAGSQRPAILVTGGFFLAGIVGLLFIDEKAGRQAAIDAERALTSGNA